MARHAIGCKSEFYYMAEDRMRILKATQAAYTDDSETAINCFITTDTGLVDEPFTAHPNDTEGYSRDLFTALQVNGLADYYAPPRMEDML